MAGVHDVAAYILDKRGPMSHMKLQSGKRDRFAYGILGLFAVAAGKRDSHRDAKAADLTLLAGCGMALLQ